MVEEFLQSDRRAAQFVQEEANLVQPSVADFYSGQSVLITGATGFLGGLLLEKLLRSCPDIGTVFVLIRESKKTGQDAESRLKKLLSSPIFNKTEESKKGKVVAVPGDISAVGLRLSVETCNLIRDKVTVVFHVAASLNFSSPLTTALNINVLGTRRVLRLCNLIRNIKALVYISTAYCNCTQRSVVAEQVYPTVHDPDRLIASLEGLSPAEVAESTPGILAGHPNTYSFTKLLAENLILRERGGVPVAIVRPSIVLGTLREPLLGWVDNVHNGAFAFIAGAGKGVFRTILADGNKVADMVPCDQVVNLIISAASHVSFSGDGVKVFHMSSGGQNPLRWGEYAKLTEAGIRRNPFLYPVWLPGARCRSSLPWAAVKLLVTQFGPAVILYLLARARGCDHILLGIQKKYLRGMLLTRYFTVNEWQFSTTNTEALASTLSPSDLQTFNFDVKQISWPDYIDKCVLGVKRFYHNEQADVDQIALNHYNRSWWLDLTAKCAVFLLVFLLMNHVLGSSLTSSVFALTATYNFRGVLETMPQVFQHESTTSVGDSLTCQKLPAEPECLLLAYVMESYNMLESPPKDKTNCHVAEEGWTQELTDDKVSITCGRSNPETQKHWRECTCRTVGTRGLQDKEGEGGPWHRLKTVFLVIIIVLLAIWLVVYVMLSRKSLIH